MNADIGKYLKMQNVDCLACALHANLCDEQQCEALT